MNERDNIINLIKGISGQSNVLTIPRIFIAILDGNIKSALFLSQCVYWADKMGRPFYKTYEEWHEEIGLTRSELDSARKDCMGLVIATPHRADNKVILHYRVDWDALSQAVINKLASRNAENMQSQTAENLQSRGAENLQSGVQKTCSPLTETTTENTTEIKNIALEKNEKLPTHEDYIKSNREALLRGYARHKSPEEDRVNEYPEDVRPIISAVCELFNLKCPSIKSSHAGHWIREARELCDACGEFEKQVLVEIAEDTERHKRLKGGTMPFYISGPGSLSNPARAKAGEMRNRKPVTSDTYNGYAIPHGASRVYIDGKEFIPGVGEVKS